MNTVATVGNKIKAGTAISKTISLQSGRVTATHQFTKDVWPVISADGSVMYFDKKKIAQEVAANLI